MFGRQPKLPVTPEQQEWIESSFQVLIGLFGVEWVRNASLVLPTDQFFPRKYEPTEDWAAFALGCVCDLMKVSRERVELVFGEDPWAHLKKTGLDVGTLRGAAGTYHEVKVGDGPSRAIVHIKKTLLEDPEPMIAVMAHELSHVLLLGDGKISRDFEKMEPLTDLMTVFSGFGVFNANAAFVHKRSASGWSVGRHGYLSPPEFAYSLAVFAWIRGERNPSWGRELTRTVRVYMQDSLKYFRATNRVD